ncbi:MAG TPA: hypothetical protein VNM91_04605 [Dehalococcoidia bacterium]|nr:hypothetical protein [Dehalococcoidia bacterium]
MMRFTFADAFWFRLPLRALMVATAAFALVTLYPALRSGTSPEAERAIFGLVVVIWFVVTGALFASAIDDGGVEVDGDFVSVRFESFFNARFPLSDIVAVREIDPRPRWRYRFGLSTNFRDRISCSHGGRLLEVELARPQRVRLWPRDVDVARIWLAVTEHDRLLAELTRVAAAHHAGGRAEAA